MIWWYPYFWKHPNCSYHLVEFIIWNILEPSFLFYATLFSGNLKNVFSPHSKTKKIICRWFKVTFSYFSSPIVGGHQQPLRKGHVNSPSQKGHFDWITRSIIPMLAGKIPLIYITYILPIGWWKISPIPPVVREPETAEVPTRERWPGAWRSVLKRPFFDSEKKGKARTQGDFPTKTQ